MVTIAPVGSTIGASWLVHVYAARAASFVPPTPAAQSAWLVTVVPKHAQLKE